MARPTILLVDDNWLFLQMEKDYLQPYAVMVHTARTGQEAIDFVRMIRPDLVFMDLHMPEMDGATCCAHLKADPDMREIPVVMIVTADSDEELKRCRLAGCDHVITKPVDRKTFLRTGCLFLPELVQVDMRVPCLALVVFCAGGKTHYGTSANLSSQGMFIAFDEAVEVDDRINITFLIPGSEGDVVVATGRVAWLNNGSPLRKPSLPRGFGVEFIDVEPGGAKVLAAFLDRLISQGAAPVVEGAYLADPIF
jgi:CheY-like chemotaxis protein